MISKIYWIHHGIPFINFPIPDREVPKPDDKIEKLLNHLADEINDGHSVVIHCRMGIGRASIIAAAVLLKNGFNADDAISSISKARQIKVPDTEQQLAWLKLRQQNRKSYAIPSKESFVGTQTKGIGMDTQTR